MKSYVLNPPAAAFVLAVALGLFASPARSDYSLVWSDEFNGTSLDLNNWSYDIGTGCPNLCGWGNNELQYYRSENVAVSGGNLVITSLEESFGGSDYTSGKVTTRDKQSFLYGRIEMRAKIPTGGGMWPAFWMMPQDDAYGGWAASGEIDIMEAANATTSIGGTIHYGGGWPNNTYSGGSYSAGGTNFADDFHVYSIEWEPDEIRWYVDGNLYSTKTSAQWYSDGAPGNPQAPFDQDFYILLNTAVGGNYTGCTESSCITAALPQQYLIDYVRVYQDIPNTAPTVTITSPGSGATLPAGDITIDASASDTDGTIAVVEFYDGAAYLGADSTAPYSHVWSAVPDGCYMVVARALDDLGGESRDSVDITVGTGCGQAPYHGQPFVLPATIQAEDFDLGGQGVAYFDSDAGNNGSQYRTSEDVDIETCADLGGGYNIGWMNPNEYLEYTVNVPATGEYPVDVRVASQSSGGSFRVEFGGQDVSGTLTVPVTGGWQTWTTVSTTVVLTAGTQTMRFVSEASGFNLNSFDFPSVPTSVAPAVPVRNHVLHAAEPNPFNPVTTIRYELGSRALVNLTIHDVAGRLVRTAVAGESRSAGMHEHVWNGTDQSGRGVASGVYFYRMDAGAFSETKRMVLVR